MPGLLYTAKGTSALLVPLASLYQELHRQLAQVFVVAAMMNLIVAALALFVLKPMRARVIKHG